MATKSPATGGMQDIILTRVNALVSEMSEAKGIAEANVSALVDAAAKDDPDYAKVEELRNAFVAAWDALKDKVRDSVDVPSEQDQENAKKSVIEIRKKMRDLYGAIPTILDIPIENVELPEEFTNEVVKQKSSTGTGIRRPRIDGAHVSYAANGEAVQSWDKDITITKMAEFLEVENAALMIHVPEDLKSHDKVEFAITPDSGRFKDKVLAITLIPRK